MGWKTWAVIASLVVSFASGVAGEKRLGDARLAKLEAETAERIAKQEEESYEVYRKQQEALAEALAARDKALRSAGALRRDAVRLRQLAETRADADSGSDRLARCERLLGEGADLVGEGAELSARAVSMQQ